MPLSRRAFVKAVGVTGAGVAGAPFIAARARGAGVVFVDNPNNPSATPSRPPPQGRSSEM